MVGNGYIVFKKTSILYISIFQVYTEIIQNPNTKPTIIMMMFFEIFLLRKLSEFPSGTRTHNLQIAGETL